MDTSFSAGKRFPGLSYVEFTNRLELRLNAKSQFFKRKHFHYSGWSMESDWDQKLKREEKEKRRKAMRRKGGASSADSKTFRIGNTMQERLLAMSLRELSDKPNAPCLRKCLPKAKPCTSGSKGEKTNTKRENTTEKAREKSKEKAVVNTTNRGKEKTEEKAMDKARWRAMQSIKEKEKNTGQATQNSKKMGEGKSKDNSREKRKEKSVKTIEENAAEKAKVYSTKKVVEVLVLDSTEDAVIGSTTDKREMRKGGKCWRFEQRHLYLPIVFKWEKMKTTNGYPRLKPDLASLC